MDAIENALQDDRVSYVRIDGSTSTTARADRIAQFQNDDDTIVALLSIKVCGTGMNLTRANVALFAELDWAPGLIHQAEDRIHRLGQRSRTVRLLYVLVRGSSDEMMWDLLQRKTAVTGSVVGVAADQQRQTQFKATALSTAKKDPHGSSTSGAAEQATQTQPAMPAPQGGPSSPKGYSIQRSITAFLKPGSLSTEPVAAPVHKSKDLAPLQQHPHVPATDTSSALWSYTSQLTPAEHAPALPMPSAGAIPTAPAGAAPTAPAAVVLSTAMRAQIEANRQAALARRQAKLHASAAPSAQAPPVPTFGPQQCGVFTTGRGTVLQVSEASLQHAEELLRSIPAPPGPGTAYRPAALLPPARPGMPDKPAAQRSVD